jgi:hypothetical protein
MAGEPYLRRQPGYGMSAENQRQCPNFWNISFKMQADFGKTLLYWAKEFDRYCEAYSKELGNITRGHCYELGE